MVKVRGVREKNGDGHNNSTRLVFANCPRWLAEDQSNRASRAKYGTD